MNFTRARLGLVLWCSFVACGGDGGAGADTEGTSSTDPSSSGQGSQSSSPTDPSGSSSDTTATTDGADASSSGDITDPTSGEDEPVLPTPDGPCPEFMTGDLEFQPAETGPRQARVYFDPSTGGGGPLVFWFHGTGGDAADSEDALDDLEAIVAMGGMMVMPYNDPATGQFPWWLTTTQREDDLHLMDEIVGCAAAGPGIDARHIHSAGFSAGALATSQAAIRRASYIASTVTISGGLYSESTPSDAPDQVVSAMIFHGGPSDVAGGLEFEGASEIFRTVIENRGGYALMCNHGMGHFYTSDRNVAFDFMMAHPFGTDPSPFETEGLPSWVPAYCQ